MGGRTLSYAQRFAGQETHRFLVVHAHEVGLQGRLRQELDRLLLGLLHELESGIDRFHADGEDRNLGRNRVEDRVTRGGHASVCARAASTAASVRDDGCLVRVCCYGYAVRRSGGAEVRCGGGTLDVVDAASRVIVFTWLQQAVHLWGKIQPEFAQITTPPPPFTILSCDS